MQRENFKKLRMRAARSLFFVLILSANPAISEVRVMSTDWSGDITGTSPYDTPHVLLDGPIVSGMEIEFEKAVEETERLTPFRTMGGSPIPNVILKSNGGDVLAAMKMGEIARAKGAATFVMNGSDCASACVLVFAGGVERLVFAGGRLGLHRPAFKDFEGFARLSQKVAINNYTEVLEMTRSYFTAMGINSEFADRFLSVSSSDMVYIDVHQAEELGIVGSDPVYAEWDLARFRSAVSEEEYKAWTEYSNCLKACPTGECQAACPRN